jgi:hypothetical protein
MLRPYRDRFGLAIIVYQMTITLFIVEHLVLNCQVRRCKFLKWSVSVAEPSF